MHDSQLVNGLFFFFDRPLFETKHICNGNGEIGFFSVILINNRLTSVMAVFVLPFMLLISLQLGKYKKHASSMLDFKVSYLFLFVCLFVYQTTLAWWPVSPVEIKRPLPTNRMNNNLLLAFGSRKQKFLFLFKLPCARLLIMIPSSNYLD